jgi:hypothetical protein
VATHRTPNTQYVGLLLGSLIRKADKIARKEIERLARKIMTDHPELRDFKMGNGEYIFDDQNDFNRLISGDDPRVAELERFIFNWDKTLHLTGDPMRIKNPKDPIVLDW